MKSRLLLLLFFLLATVVRAQDYSSKFQVITADNASRLKQIGRYGNGVFELAS